MNPTEAIEKLESIAKVSAHRYQQTVEALKADPSNESILEDAQRISAAAIVGMLSQQVGDIDAALKGWDEISINDQALHLIMGNVLLMTYRSKFIEKRLEESR